MKKRRLIILLVLILIILAVSAFAYIFFSNNLKEDEKETIIATKTSEEDEKKTEIKYTVEIKEYKIESIKKEIVYDNREKAQIEYERIQTINDHEQKNIKAEVKNKKLMVTIPEDVFLEEIEYDEKDNITMISSSGEPIQIVDQDAILQALQQQGYSIK